MTQTLNELLAATDGVKAVWLCEQLFNGRWIDKTEEYERHYAIDVPLLNDKDDAYGVQRYSELSEPTGNWMTLVTWLTSPDGLHAIETAMIERGYIYDFVGIKDKYGASFEHNTIGYYVEFQAITKSEAVINAAIKALWGENE